MAQYTGNAIRVTADRDCVLKASDDSKATVRYAKHALDIAEVQAHIAAGKMPTQLAVTWDSKVSFVLMDTGCVKKLEFLDAAFDGRSPEEREKGFDADAAIVTGMLAKMLPDLVEALGGEFMPETGLPA
jgi:recombination associated protein RdgC